MIFPPACRSIFGAMHFGRFFVKKRGVLMVGIAALALSGCPGGGIGVKYTVGGTLTGVAGTVVLEDNSGDALSLDSNGGFVFGSGLANSDAYSVTVKTQPSNPVQTCIVHNGSGTIDRADVTNVIVSCTRTGRFAYAANQVSNDISAYAIDAANGVLLPLAGAPFAASGTTPTALAVDPNGQFLYAANNGSNDVSVFSIDAGSGALMLTGIPTAAGSGPGALIVDPTNHYLYVANLASDNISAYAIDGGVLTEIVNSPFNVGAEPASLAIDPNGNFLYVTNFSGANVAVFAIDLANGSLSNISGSPFGSGNGPLSIAIDPTDSFAYVANEAAGTISAYSLNASTGQLTNLSGSPIPVGSNPESLAADPAGRYLYAANVSAANQVASYSIAPASGALSLLSTLGAGSLPIDVVVDPSGQFIYAANYNSNDISAYTVDAATGALAPVAGSPFGAGTRPHSIAID
jgi:6-phosphogluconolactonase